MAAAANGIFRKINSHHQDREQDKYSAADQADEGKHERHNLCAPMMIHPFVLDHMSNEVDSTRRFDALEFPDINILRLTAVGEQEDNDDLILH